MITPLPVGGSTGLDHESTHSIDEATTWLAMQPFQIAVSDLCSLFGLAISEALIARSEAQSALKI